MKLSPNSLNEWTLEFNLVSELTTMFNTPFGLLYPLRLRSIFDMLNFDYRRLTLKKAKTYKLTPAEEGNGGGWDVKYVIPQSFNKSDRIIYLQIKSGKHNEGNSETNSIFNTTICNPNKHIEFSFNDNAKPKKSKLATQHSDLKKLNDYLINSGFSDKSVLYAFPRITSLTVFETLDEPLIFYTTFLSINQMDAISNANGINLYDGVTHHYRCCYINEIKREIASNPFAYNGEDESINVLTEIFCIKIAHIWNQYYSNINHERLKDYIVFEACSIMKINPFNNSENPFYIENELIIEDLKYYFKSLQFLRENKELELLRIQPDAQSSNVRVKLLEKILAFVNKLENEVNYENDIPQVYTNHIYNPKNQSENDNLDFGEINVNSIIL